jgi:hypothetical protein
MGGIIMKPFNLEEAKRGKPVCTRNGDPVRIICFDKVASKSGIDYPIVALVTKEDTEQICLYTNDGRFDGNHPDPFDLMMVSATLEGWINVCRDRENNKPFCYHGKIFETKEDARAYLKQMATMAPKTFPNVVETVQIYWEE